MALTEQLTADRNQKLLEDIQALETKAMRFGLTVTAHALNNAKNAAGWEMAGDTVTAGLAARGARPGKS